MTLAQRGFGLLAPQTAGWIDASFLPDRPVHTTGQAVFIDAAIDHARLVDAIMRTVAESDALRVHLQVVDREVRQVPQDTVAVDLPVVDLAGASDPEIAASEWMAAAIRRVFPLDAVPLFGFALLRLGPRRCIWFQVFHHLVIDAVGRQILTRRTAEHYAGVATGERAGARFAEAKQAEDIYLASARARADRAYWLECLAGLPEPPVEADRRRSERTRSGQAARLRLVVPAVTFNRLRAAADTLATTPFRVALTLVHVAFGRSAECWDLVSAVPLNNRVGARFRDTIGLFAQIMPVRLALSREMTLAAAIARVDRLLTRSYAHRRFPVHELHAALGVGQGGRPLFDVEVNYLTTAYDFDFAGAPIRVENVSHGFILPWLITLVDAGPDRDVEITLDTDAGLITADQAARMGECLRALFEDAPANTGKQLGALPIMSAATLAEADRLAAPQLVSLPEEETLASLIAAQAARTPSATALICDTERIDHATLQARADRLAHGLAARGVKRGSVVGLMLPRTADLVVAVLAVHRAGGAYLPLDVAHPPERLAWMIADSAVPVVVTTQAMAVLLAGAEARIVRLDQPEDLVLSADHSPLAPGPDDLAYVLYTSGSTGLPKAVGVEHRNAVNLVRWGVWLLGGLERPGVLFSTSLGFDISVFEIFVPLASGGKVVLVENLFAFPSAPARGEAQVINTGPSLMAALLASGPLPATVRTVILAGEALSRHVADRLFAGSPAVRLLNLYGPTECTVYATWAEIGPDEPAAPAIGRAIWNTELRVLDPDRRMVPPGAPGELWIGGAGVARGYLNRPELSAERFIANPFGPGRLYRTGDQVRWRPDGSLHYLRRLDDQMKINGLRVEPGEIEAALRRQPGIEAAAVVLRPDPAGTRRLVAWLVARSARAGPELSELRLALARELPPHMVPHLMGWIDALPLNANGKLDRRALPALPDVPVQPLRSAAPATPLEHQVAALWQDVLRCDEVGPTSDFFQLGGDSLAAVSMFALVEQRFGVRLTAEVLAGGVTVARLATHIGAGTPHSDPAAVVTLQPLGNKAPFFCVPGVGGDVLHLVALARRMGSGRPFLALRTGAAAGRGGPDGVEGIAARCVAAMVARQPAGPYLLGGYSAGATIAFEIARQLTRQGHRVDLLALIDTPCPGFRMTWRSAPAVARHCIRNLPPWISDDLAHSSLHQILRDIRRKLRRLAGVGASVERVVDLSRYPQPMREAIQANYEAVLPYRAGAWAGRATVLRTRAQPLLRLHGDACLGWSAVASGGIDLRVLPGNHRSVMREPHVAALAAALLDCLAGAEKCYATAAPSNDHSSAVAPARASMRP